MQQFFWRRLVVIGGLCGALSAGAAPMVELVVGQSLPLSGEQAALGRQLRLGADLWFAHVNATGGIQGTPIRHVVLDDAFDPSRVVRNTRQLVQQEQVSVLMGYPQAQGVRAVLAQKLLTVSGVPLLGPATGADWLREPVHPQVFPVRTGHVGEAEHLAGHLAMLGARRITMLHAADEDGFGAQDALRAALARKGLALAGAAAFGPSGADGAVLALRAWQPEAVVLMAPAPQVAAFAKAWRGAGETAHLLSFARADHQEVLAQAGTSAARGMGFTQVVPYPYGGARPLVREYRGLLATYGPMDAAPSYAGFEAFIAAKVLVEALRRAGGTAWTPGRVATALEQLGTLELGGFVVRHARGERHGARYVDFTVLGSEGQLLR